MTEPRLDPQRIATEPRLDPQRVAALLDGRLPERERAEALAQVAASDADQELLADAAAVLAELEGEDEGPRETDGVTPLRPPGSVSRRRRPSPGWLALAAVVAGLLALSPTLLSLRDAGPDADPARLAARLAAPGSPLPEGWTEQRPWSATRGGGERLSPDARGVRLGVLLMDLEIAVRARQAAPTALLAAQAGALLAGVSGSGMAAAELVRIHDAAGGPPEALEAPLDRAREGAAGLVGEDPVRLGSWAEAARLAADRGDTAFFRSRDTRRTLEWAAELKFLEDDARAAVEEVRSAAGGDAPDIARLRRALDELLRTAGG